MGDAGALKLAAVGWTIAILAVSWASIERRGRKRAEQAINDHRRESDADRHLREHKLREAVTAMREALRDLNDEP